MTGRFIILRKLKYSEADLIVHALSEQGAKLSFIAKSALKSKKRFGGGVLEPPNWVHLTYKLKADSGSLQVLQEATLIHDFVGIRQSYEHMQLALRMVECVHKVSQDGDIESATLYGLLGHGLKAVEKTDNLSSLKLQFYVKFLWQQGVLTPEGVVKKILSTPLQEPLPPLPDCMPLLSSLEQQVVEYLQSASVS